MSSQTSECNIPATPGVPTSRRWSGPDLVIGSALVVVLASLFLPWFAAADMDAVAAARAAGQTHGGSTVSGVDAHGYLWIVFALVIVALAVLVGRDSFTPAAGQPAEPGPGASRRDGAGLPGDLARAAYEADRLGPLWL